MEREKKDVLVVGGGASGMMAAIAAGENGHRVTLLERNEKLGKKIYITGKGRCNVTNTADADGLFENIVSSRKFMYAAYDALDNTRLMERIEAHGTRLKTERGGRVFPVSDHVSDITRALERNLKEAGVHICLHTNVQKLLSETLSDGSMRITGVQTDAGERIPADHVILATGGYAYPSTGSTGDGHQILLALHVKMTDIRPALVPLETAEAYIPQMQGLSLRNVRLRIESPEDAGAQSPADTSKHRKKRPKKPLFEDFGELLFTHFGISGPLALTASSYIGKYLYERNDADGAGAAPAAGDDLSAAIDLKPALSDVELDRRLLREIEENRNRQYRNFYRTLLPAKLAPVIVNLSDIPADKRIGDITREGRQTIGALLKGFPFTVTGTRSFSEAIITQGGVDVRQVDPSTMRIKGMEGLSVCGELLDVDALTGGFNLQCAFSTGYLAGIRA